MESDSLSEQAPTVIAILSVVPPTAPFAPIVKALFDLASLSARGRDVTEACRAFLDRIVGIHESKIRLLKVAPDPEKARQPIDDAMEEIMVELSESKPLEGLPLDIILIGRDHDHERILVQLAKRNRHGFTEHISLVGPGGIGKTSLATRVAHDPRTSAFGRAVFIRCESLATLVDFQTELLRLCAPHNLLPGENLGDSVREVLGKERIFLILDNLLDSTDATAHTTYLHFIDSITSIPSLTLLITSRNRVFIGRNTPRKVHGIPLLGLSADAAEELFRATHADALGDGERKLETNEPCMTELMALLDRMPLAIVLVAAHARKAASLEEVIRRCKAGRALDNGAQGRTTSVDYSLSLSFSDPSINNRNILTLLRLLAELPNPVLRRCGAHSEIISRAFDAIIERSIGQLGDSWTSGKSIRILQPIREYILRHHSPLDVNSDTLTAGITGADFETAWIGALLSFNLSSQEAHEMSGLIEAMEQAKEHKLYSLYEQIARETSLAYTHIGDQEKAYLVYEAAGDSCLQLKHYHRAVTFLARAFELNEPGKSLTGKDTLLDRVSDFNRI
ncbi:hypothetical protein RQP46_009950 [Phenoliferia psychrophenolica]